jgi:hypothetical protein
MKTLSHFCYNILGAASLIEQFIFGIRFETLGYRILNFLFPCFGLIFFLITFGALRFPLYFSILFSMTPIVYLFVFHKNYTDARFEIEMQKFNESSRLNKFFYCTLILLPMIIGLSLMILILTSLIY